MKYCPKCGTPLEDDTRFCPKCGTAQPNMGEEPTQQEVEVKQEAKPQQQLSDKERFNNLLNTDERFKTIVRTSKLAGLFTLVNLAFIIPFFILLFTKTGAFTGVDVSAQGTSYFDVLGVHYFPYGYSSMSIRQFIAYAKAGGYKLTPDDGLKNGVPLIIFIAGLLFIPLTVVISLLGRPKGYILRTYEKENGINELIKSIKSPMTLILGPFLVVLASIPAIGTYVNSTGFSYKEGHYIFGQVTGLKSGLTTAIVVAILFFSIILAANIVLRVLFVSKPLKPYTPEPTKK